MKKGKRKFAVFDIDGTIFRSSLVIEFTETMIDEGILHESVREKYKKEKLRWADRKGSYEAYINAVVVVFAEAIKGIRYEDFRRASKIVVGRHRDRVYRYTRDIIKDMKKKKYFILAISKSPKVILDEFCGTLGFDQVHGTVYEVNKSHRMTGKCPVEVKQNGYKANLLKKVIKNENLTMRGSIGVGDTEGDISFLELVENPICFNPNLKLYTHAQKKKWKIVVERKDVIFEI